MARYLQQVILAIFVSSIYAMKIEALKLIQALGIPCLNSIPAIETREREIVDWICSRLDSGAGNSPAN